MIRLRKPAKPPKSLQEAAIEAGQAAAEAFFKIKPKASPHARVHSNFSREYWPPVHGKFPGASNEHLRLAAVAFRESYLATWAKLQEELQASL